MEQHCIVSTQSVTLVGGGSLLERDLVDAVALAPMLVAADGGADRLLEAGLRPEFVIGDLDSIQARQACEAGGAKVIHLAEQDTTDFEKCLYTVDAPLAIGVGFLGGRIDHALAALHVLARYRHRAILLVGQEDIVFHCPPRLDLRTRIGMRVSLFPLGETTGQRGVGLRWNVEGLTLSPMQRIGTSNEAVAKEVSLAFDRPGMIVILPREMLEEAARALVVAVGTSA